jgi:serine/threonine protein kinase
MINRTIKDYEIKQLIATGGMAAIYRAIQTTTGKTLAIKILHGHLAQDKDFITRFEREARAAAALKHENIIDIIGYGETEGVYYIAMEFVEGKSLKELIHSVRFIPSDIALAIVYEICRGLEHAHQKGVVHRDIKPANILIARDGAVKITDFGLAQAQDLTSITVTGALVGTPAYMSPEQAAGRKIDTRSDLFSLGVVIYEMITGTKPFQGESYSSVIHAILTIPAPRPMDANPTMDEAISLLIEKSLQKDPDQRYQNITQISDDIYAYFRAQNIEVPNKQISAFITEPERMSTNWIQDAKEKHLRHALHHMNSGTAGTDQAISEFVKVHYLDPEDTQASKYLAELKRKIKARARVKKKMTPAPPKRAFVKMASVFGAILVIMTSAAALYKNYQNNRTGLPHHGYLYVDSKPGGAAVYLDNADLARQTPANIDSVTTGEHIIEIKKNGYRAYKTNIQVKAGDTITVDAPLIKEMATAGTGSITIESKPSGAQVFVDGINTGHQTPYTVEDIPAGSHDIKISKSGYKTTQLTRNVQIGQTTRISANLSKTQSRATQSSTQKAYFRVNVDPWAKIYIDGQYIETTPIARAIEISAGGHLVKLDNPSYQSWQKRVNFKPGETVSMDIKLEPFAGYLRISVRPWADVYIDGKFRETTPIAEPIQLPAGRHTVKLINPSFETHEEVVTIVANQTTKKSVELLPK